MIYSVIMTVGVFVFDNETVAFHNISKTKTLMPFEALSVDERVLKALDIEALPELLTLFDDDCFVVEKYSCHRRERAPKRQPGIPQHRRNRLIDIYRVNDNARRHVYAWVIMKLMMGIDYKIMDGRLTKDLWHCFRLTCKTVAVHRDDNIYTCVNPRHFELSPENCRKYKIFFNGQLDLSCMPFSRVGEWRVDETDDPEAPIFIETPNFPPVDRAMAASQAFSAPIHTPKPRVKRLSSQKRRYYDDSGDESDPDYCLEGGKKFKSYSIELPYPSHAEQSPRSHIPRSISYDAEWVDTPTSFSTSDDIIPARTQWYGTLSLKDEYGQEMPELVPLPAPPIPIDMPLPAPKLKSKFLLDFVELELQNMKA